MLSIVLKYLPYAFSNFLILLLLLKNKSNWSNTQNKAIKTQCDTVYGKQMSTTKKLKFSVLVYNTFYIYV